MIVFEDFRVSRGESEIYLESISSLPCDRNMVLYCEKRPIGSLLIAAIAGSVSFEGKLCRNARVSYPFGYSGFFRSDLDVKDNIEYVGEVFGCEASSLVERVCAFPGLEHLLDRPMVNLPRFAQTKLSYALGYCVGFECLLIDGALLIGDEPFRSACSSALADHKGGYISLTDTPRPTGMGDCGAILNSSRLEVFGELSLFQAAIGGA